MLCAWVAALVLSPAKIADERTDWHEPSSREALEMLDYSSAEIARMSRKKQESLIERAYAHRKSIRSGWTQLMVTGDYLRTVNRRLAARQGKPTVAQMERLRQTSFRFGMACIDTYATLSGGNAVSNHEPDVLFPDTEEMIHAILQGKPGPKSSPKDLDRVFKALQECRDSRQPLVKVVGGGLIDLKELHRYAGYALTYRASLEQEKAHLAPKLRSNVDKVLIRFGELVSSEFEEIKKHGASPVN